MELDTEFFKVHQLSGIRLIYSHFVLKYYYYYLFVQQRCKSLVFELHFVVYCMSF